MSARRAGRFASVTMVAMVAIAALACAARSSVAQQPPARVDSVPLRADYRDLAELLQKLPSVTPPILDEPRALWLGALPLACLDRLQSRPSGRGNAAGGAGRGNAPSDTVGGRGRGAIDSSGRGGDGRAGTAATTTGPTATAVNNGAGYFWVPTYSLVPDHDRLRAFWGCNDWHSAVGSTWVTVRLLKTFPKSALRELAREKLNAHLGKSNLNGELTFFHDVAAAINPIPSASQQGLYERPYGFAWLLQLQSELRTWPDSQGQRWAANVAPLATWMADSIAAYFAKLVEPVRAGGQTNTAHSMTLVLDYADAVGDTKLRRSVSAVARKFFLADTSCATQSERVVAAAGRGGRGRGGGRGASVDTSTRASTLPNDLTAAAGRGGAAPPGGGQVFLSPCLTEAALMSRVLDQRTYIGWIGSFLPPLQSARFSPLTEAINIPVSAPPPANAPTVTASARGGTVDTSAAAMAAAAAAAATALANERARLAALSFSRAQAMERIARALPAADARVEAWHRLSAIQADRGFELMRDDSAGIYWLPAQALLYETVRKR